VSVISYHINYQKASH